MIKKYLLYIIRWQLSTPILALCFSYFSNYGNVMASVIANFIGALIFFWVDRAIFKERRKNEEENNKA